MTHDRIAQLYWQGEYARTIDLAEALHPSEAGAFVLVAHAHALLGGFSEASRLLQRLTKTEPAAPIRATLEMVRGRLAHMAGRIDESREHYQAASRLSLQCRDFRRHAWAELSRFRLELSNSRLDIAAGLLSSVRHGMMKAATSDTVTLLHICVADLDAWSGRLDEARRQADIAESLLGDQRNPWLTTALLLNRALVAILSCRLTDAADHVRAGQALARHSRNRQRSLMFEGNLARLDFLRGDLWSARARFAALLREPDLPAPLWCAAAEGLARVHLTEGEADECAQVLASLDDRIAVNAELGVDCHAKWSNITRARLLIARRDFPAALACLSGAHLRYQHHGDNRFMAVLEIARAQAYIAQGDPHHALTAPLSSARLGAPTFRGIDAQYYYVMASLTPAPVGGRTEHLRDRARRIWTHYGMPCAEAELMPAASAIAVDVPPADCRASGFLPVALLEGITACFDLAFSQDLALEERRAIATALRDEFGSDHALTEAALDRLSGMAIELDRLRRREQECAALWPAPQGEPDADALFVSPEMQALAATIRQVAATDVPILITGESGTGKEVLARMAHAYSKRASAGFLPFNCTGVPREMLDSQLFGHRRGAFTGAVDSFRGVIRSATNGTLFLDEIAETGLEIQPKLLRFLESGEVHPIGEAHPVMADVRVVAATNADIEMLVSTGRFREDLFYRLNVVRLHVPPLRERRLAIPALVTHYLQKHARQAGKDSLRIAEETMEYLLLYHWPGNVRQLVNEVRRLVALAAPGAVLMPEHLSPEIAASRRTRPPADRECDPAEIAVRLDQPLGAAVQHLEDAMIQYAMSRCDGHMEETARLLGISRKGLYLKRLRQSGAGGQPRPDREYA